jgi:hypothetical protein
VKICYRADIGGTESRYRLKGFSIVGLPIFCCPAMEREWGRLIEFGLRGFSRPENLCACLYTHHLLSDNAIVSCLETIQFCPWCGEQIELVEHEPAFADAGFPEDF